MHLRDVHAIKLISELEQISGLKFSYESTLLNTSKTYTVNSCNLSTNEILHKLFPSDLVDFISVSNHVIILKKNFSDTEKKIEPVVTSSQEEKDEIIKNIIEEEVNAEEVVEAIEPLEPLDFIEIHQINTGHEKEEFIVTSDTAFRIRTNTRVHVIYDTASGIKEGVVKSSQRSHKHVAYRGKFLKNGKVKIIKSGRSNYNYVADNDTVLVRYRDARHDSTYSDTIVDNESYKWKPVTKDKTDYNRKIKVHIGGTKLIPFDNNYETDVRNEGYNNYNIALGNGGIDLAYYENSFYLCLGIYNMKAMFSKKGPISSDMPLDIPLQDPTGDIVDEYNKISPQGDTIPIQAHNFAPEVVPVVVDATDYPIEQTHYSDYIEIPFGIGYEFSLSKRFHCSAFAQGIYAVSYNKSISYLDLSEGTPGMNIFKDSYQRYNAGISVDFVLGKRFIIYGAANYSTLINYIELAYKSQNLSAWAIGGGIKINIYGTNW